MSKISAYVVSYNREDTIEACIKSLTFADEIILIDKSSNDSTLEIAKQYADKIYVLPWTPTVEGTRAYAESVCSHDWIVFLDDDEVLNNAGAKYIFEELSNPKSYIYRFPRNEYILGRHSKSAYYYPNTQIRMYKKGSIEFGESVHNGFRILIDSVFDIPLSTGVSIDHFSHKSVHDWIEKANRYTSASDRLRFYDPGVSKTYQDTIHSILSKWFKKNDNTASYENIVGTLRAVYDIIDFCKDWESKNVNKDDMLNVVAHACDKLNIQNPVRLNTNKSVSNCNEKIIARDDSTLIGQVQNIGKDRDYELFKEYCRVIDDNSVVQNKYEQLLARIKLIESSRSYRLIHVAPIVKSMVTKLLKKAANRHKAFFRRLYYSELMPEGIRAIITTKVRGFESNEILCPFNSSDYAFPNFSECNQLIKYIRFPKNQSIHLSIIIPAYGKLPVLLNCLKSIYDNPPKCEFEVIVIEDASGDKDIQRLSEIDGLKYIQNQINLGFTRNCNKAVEFARGMFLYFLNDDTQVQSDTIDALLRVSVDNTVGVVGSKLVYPTNILQEAGGIVWKDGSAWNYGRGRNPNDLEFNYQRDVDYCSGASLLIKKSIFEQVGKFDELYAPAYCEDTDLAFKVRSLGLRVVYEPQSVVTHYEGKSHGTNLNAGAKAYQTVNQKKFFEKWKSTIENYNFDNGTNISRAIYSDKNKKFVLIVDNNTPFYEKDAGSKTIIEIARIYKNCGYAVHFLPLNSYIGEDAHRLQLDGVYVIKSANPSKYISKNLNLYENIFLSRPESSYLILKSCDIPRSKLIYYGHDIHFERLKLKNDLLNIDEGSRILERKEKYIWKSCGIILYPSSDEVKIVKEFLEHEKIDTEVRELPVFVSRMLDFNNLPKHSERFDLLFVGSNHHPNEDAMNFLIAEILPKITENLTNINLHVVGSVCDAIPDHQSIIKHGIVSDAELERLYLCSRIFVAPLRYGMGVKGKIIDAFDYGCPVVTTDIGAQGLINAGLVPVNSALDFTTLLIDLYNSEEKWNSAAKFSSDFVHKNYTLERVMKALDLS
jgi:GT2 family glycosyltransferase